MSHDFLGKFIYNLSMNKTNQGGVMSLFRGINFENLEDGEYIQFFGVHMLSWGDIERATGIKPTIAFIEDDTLEKQNAKLLEALQHLGSRPDGYCFCPREIPSGDHTGECREACEALAQVKEA